MTHCPECGRVISTRFPLHECRRYAAHKGREQLVEGDHIYQCGNLSADLGACWTAGVWYDLANHCWYVCDRGTVVGVFQADRVTFSQEPYKEALRLYQELKEQDEARYPKGGA